MLALLERSLVALGSLALGAVVLLLLAARKRREQ